MTIERPMFPPVDPTRRHLLTIAAGGAVAAAVPAAALTASPSLDPIFAVIQRHKEVLAAYDAAVNVRGCFNDINMNDEQREQLAVLVAAVDDAYEHMEDVGSDLVDTKPTTLAGIGALCRYIEPFLNENDSPNLPQVIYWDDDTESSAAGAFANVIAAAVNALIDAQVGRTVQS